MNTDFRIEVDFFEHHKTTSLIGDLGLPAAWALLRLWRYAAVNKPDGNLGKMTPVEISRACHYDGDPEALLTSFLNWKFIDRRYSHGFPIYSLHDWAEHQPWCAKAPVRKESARKAAELRWKRHREADAHRNAPRNAPSQPSHPTRERDARARPPGDPPSLPPPNTSVGPQTRKETTPAPDPGSGARDRMATYRSQRAEVLQELRERSPGKSEAEIRTLLAAELKRRGITA